MKIRFYQILLLALPAFFTVGENLFAQDAGMVDVELVDEWDNLESEKMLYSPGEAAVHYYTPKAYNPPFKDSVANQLIETSAPKPRIEPPVKPMEKQPAKPEDDSILSFNFLYYIIQKYKLQDIID